MDFKSSESMKGHSLGLADSLEVEREAAVIFTIRFAPDFGILAQSAAQE